MKGEEERSLGDSEVTEEAIGECIKEVEKDIDGGARRELVGTLRSSFAKSGTT
jgi:hypothetical protein